MYSKCNTGACLLVGGADLNSAFSCRTVLSSSAFLHITYVEMSALRWQISYSQQSQHGKCADIFEIFLNLTDV